MSGRIQKVTRNGLFATITAVTLSTIVGSLMLAVLTTDSTTVLAPKPSKPTGIVPPNDYGFSADELVWMDADQQAQRLDKMKATGISWVRIDMEWYVVQPSGPNTYNWAVYDRAINAITQHGLKVLAILDYAPAWAARSDCLPNPDHKCAPADPASFATYAAAAASRYTPRGVASWEIWNEPNSSRFWYPGADASNYAALLEATYPAIKKVNPHAVVITGGLRSASGYGDVSPADFINALYADKAQPYFDALGAHPYSYPSLPSGGSHWNGWVQMVEMRAIAVAHGDTAKTVWMTEVGAPTGGAHQVGERRQAQIVQEVIQLHNSYSWAGPLFLYDYQDLSADSSAAEASFGLVRFNGTPKPAYTSFVQSIK